MLSKLLLAGLAVILSFSDASAGEIGEYKDAPSTPFFDENDKATTLGAFKGKVLLVNFWATWCVPCVSEMPALEELQKELGDKGLEVLAISQDFKGLEAVKKFYTRNRIQGLKAYSDKKGKLYGQFNGKGLPFSVFISREGKVLSLLTGEIDWHSPAMKGFIKDLL